MEIRDTESIKIEEVAMILGTKEIEIYALQKKIQVLRSKLDELERLVKEKSV